MPDITSVAQPEPEWAAFAAIDWADKKHVWRLVPADSTRHEQGALENTPEAVDVWARGLAVRFGGRPIAVCLEQSRGPLVYTLSKYAHQIVTESANWFVENARFVNARASGKTRSHF